MKGFIFNCIVIENQEDNLFSLFFLKHDNLECLILKSRKYFPDYTFIEIKLDIFQKDLIIDEILLDIQDSYLFYPNFFNENQLSLISQYSDLSNYGTDLESKIKLFKNSKVLGLTDQFSTQNFISFLNLSEKYNFKPVLGLEFLLTFKDKEDILINVKNKDLLIKDISFLVIDLETTGIFFHTEKIIEIGYCLINEELNIEDLEENFLKDPDEEIMISDKMKIFLNLPKNFNQIAISRKEILNKLMNLLQNNPNLILVSHRKFDLIFLKSAIKNYFNIDFNPNYIDAVDLFKLSFPELKKINSISVAKHLDIAIDLSCKHKAIYDARITALSFLKTLKLCWDFNKPLTQFYEKKISDKHTEKFITTLYLKNNDSIPILNFLITKSLENDSKRIIIDYTDILLYKDYFILVAQTKKNSHIYEDFLFNKGYLDKSIINLYDFIAIDSTINNILNGNELITIENNINSFQKFFNILLDFCPDKLIFNNSINFILPIQIYSKLIAKTISTHYINNIENSYLNSKDLIQNIDKFVDIDNKWNLVSIMRENKQKLIDQINIDNLYKKYIFTLNNEDYTAKIYDLLNQYGYEKYGKVWDKISHKAFDEINKLSNRKFERIFYLVHNLLKKIRIQFPNIIFGSRGTVGSSFSAFILDITEINPLSGHYFCKICGYLEFSPQICLDLPIINCSTCNIPLNRSGFNINFAMFCGFEAEKSPDIDLNIPTYLHLEVRETILDLIKQEGLEAVFSSSLLKLQEKSSLFYVRKYCLETKNNLSDNYINLISYFLVNTKVISTIHPGGIQIFNSKENLYTITAIQINRDSKEKITHLDYSNLHDSSFKLDILAHDDPTVLSFLCKETKVSESDIIFDNEILNLFKQGKTLGLPEFGTNFTTQILKEIRIKNFNDLIKISGLTHGTNVWKNNGEIFFKSGIPFNDIIGCRDDIFNFLIEFIPDSSKVFKISEFIRKGGVRSDIILWEEYKSFLKEMHVPDWYINSCSKIIYCFPRAHAAAYVLLCLKIAFFKVYFPKEFYKAYLDRKINFLTYDIFFETKNKHILTKDKLDQKNKTIYQTVLLLKEMYNQNFKFSKPDLYLSNADTFNIVDNIFYLPFILIKSFGQHSGIIIENERKKGKFKDMYDFIERTGLHNSKIKLLSDEGILPFNVLEQTTLF